MNIDWRSNQYSDASGANKQNNQLLLLNCVFNGYGSTDSFIRSSGETYWWILPKVNIDLFNRVLADFAQHFGIGKNKRIILVVDRAGWHTSDHVKVPKGIHLFFLPAYSPELQPAERLWPLTNQPIANRCFESLDELEVVLCDRCRRLLQQQELIRGLTFFHWWPCCAIPRA